MSEKELVLILKRFFKNTNEVEVECVETFKKMLIIRLRNKQHFCIAISEV